MLYVLVFPRKGVLVVPVYLWAAGHDNADGIDALVLLFGLAFPG